MMGHFLAVTIGGGIGAALRYWLAGVIAGMVTGPFPVAILTINILGSFTMGVLAESFALKFDVPAEVRTFLTAGILGGFTTFSSFSLEAVLMMRRGDMGYAAIYIALSVGPSIAGLFLGLWLVRTFMD
jgi:CrcB protein